MDDIWDNEIYYSSNLLPSGGDDWGEGSSYGDRHYTRPSDWMTGHFRVFDNFSNDDWSLAADSVYSFYTAHSNSSTGLVPDFYKGYDVAPANAIETKYDGEYYYNACRVPLRFAMDYAISQSSGSNVALDKIGNWLHGKVSDNASNIKAGYYLDGSGIGNYEEMSFIAPFGAGLIATPYSALMTSIWNNVNTDVFPNNDSYGPSLGILSMLVMSGNWWSPLDVISDTTVTIDTTHFTSIAKSADTTISLNANLDTTLTIDSLSITTDTTVTTTDSSDTNGSFYNKVETISITTDTVITKTINEEHPNTTPVNRELIENGDFSSSTNWEFFKEEPTANGTGTITNGTYKLTTTNKGTEVWNISFFQAPVKLYKEKFYRLTYDAKGDNSNILGASAEMQADPYTNYFYREDTLTASYQNFSSIFQMKENTDLIAALQFQGGTVLGNIYVDNVSLTERIDSAIVLTSHAIDSSFNGGDTTTITWNSTGDISTVDIKLSTDNGVTWTTIANNVDNTGSHNWTLPNENIIGGVIKVVGLDNDLVSSSSEGTVTINYVASITIDTTITHNYSSEITITTKDSTVETNKDTTVITKQFTIIKDTTKQTIDTLDYSTIIGTTTTVLSIVDNSTLISSDTVVLSYQPIITVDTVISHSLSTAIEEVIKDSVVESNKDTTVTTKTFGIYNDTTKQAVDTLSDGVSISSVITIKSIVENRTLVTSSSSTLVYRPTIIYDTTVLHKLATRDSVKITRVTEPNLDTTVTTDSLRIDIDSIFNKYDTLSDGVVTTTSTIFISKTENSVLISSTNKTLVYRPGVTADTVIIHNLSTTVQDIISDSAVEVNGDTTVTIKTYDLYNDSTVQIIDTLQNGSIIGSSSSIIDIIEMKTLINTSVETLMYQPTETVSVDTIIYIIKSEYSVYDSVIQPRLDTLVTTITYQVIDSLDVEITKTKLDSIVTNTANDTLSIISDTIQIDSSTETLTYNGSTEILAKSNSHKAVAIWPNPITNNNQILHIKIPNNSSSYRVRVFDNLGNSLFDNSGSMGGNIVEWHVDSHIGSGSYMLILETTQNNGKLIVQRAMVGVRR